MIEPLSGTDIKIIRELEGDMPLAADPYGLIAGRIGCSRAEVLQRLKSMKRQGFLRRIGAVLHHRQTGYTANGMLVCRVEEERIDQAGTALAAMERVSHCYRRRTHPGWPYNLYGMIHGKTRPAVGKTARQFVEAFDISDYKILYSTEEIKKTSMVFFSHKQW